MLKENQPDLDLLAKADELKTSLQPDSGLEAEVFSAKAMDDQDNDVASIRYPVLEFPKTIKSHNFDKNPLVEGTLVGIKGQYLMFDTGVINIRKFSSYDVRVGA